MVAEPLVNNKNGSWTIRVREIGNHAGQLAQPPQPTYNNGEGLSIFTGKTIPSDYIKTMAQQGRMGRQLYAVILNTTGKQEFRPPTPIEFVKAINLQKRSLINYDYPGKDVE